MLDFLTKSSTESAEKNLAVPFVGNYTEEKIKKAMQILKEDFAGFDAQLIIMDVVPWMLPYYEL